MQRRGPRFATPNFMIPVFAYILVSTARQGTHGVSPQEHRDAITRYAAIHGLAIEAWFEERETAA